MGFTGCPWKSNPLRKIPSVRPDGLTAMTRIEDRRMMELTAEVPEREFSKRFWESDGPGLVLGLTEATTPWKTRETAATSLMRTALEGYLGQGSGNLYLLALFGGIHTVAYVEFSNSRTSWHILHTPRLVWPFAASMTQ